MKNACFKIENTQKLLPILEEDDRIVLGKQRSCKGRYPVIRAGKGPHILNNRSISSNKLCFSDNLKKRKCLYFEVATEDFSQLVMKNVHDHPYRESGCIATALSLLYLSSKYL